MLTIDPNDPRLDYPGFYNIYPIRNETSSTAARNEKHLKHEKYLFLDDNYGRVLQPALRFHYGRTDLLPYYKRFDDYEIVDELRVPFRRIPIYRFENMQQVELIRRMIELENPGYEILLRGQTSVYTLDRPAEERGYLFDQPDCKEPSLQPSSLRNKFDEYFIYNLWHTQTALLLNDIGVDLRGLLSDEHYQEYKRDEYNIKHSQDFTLISLGIAQHYGLPSVGLDLTKDSKVATWFASHSMKTNEEGITTTVPLEDFTQSTLFIFRCPADAVYSYKRKKPKFIDNTRPDRQDAWFGHVGWGLAKNELASFLVCAIRLEKNILNLFEADYPRHLFPDKETDPMLDYFLTVRNNPKYISEVRRAFKKLYQLEG